MKVLIVAFHSRTMTPYSLPYETAIKKTGNIYDIIFFDRFTNGQVEHNEHEYIIHRVCPLGGDKLKKIIPMLSFRNSVIKIIKKENYDKIIILNTLPGVLLKDILLKQYKGKYIFDIRDYTYEKYSFYRKVVNSLVENSAFSTISSAGFLSFLKQNKKIIINHNISNEEFVKQSPSLSSDKVPIVLAFIGALRYSEMNSQLAKMLRDTKYFLSFIGISNIEWHVEDYCQRNHIYNVRFSGSFDNTKKPELYNEVDIINALYGNNSIEVTSALPNKLYDCVLFKKPIVVSAGTYLAKVVEKYGLGVVVSDLSNIKADLDYYVQKFSAELFVKNANKFLALVKEDQNVFYKALNTFLGGIG